MWLVQSCDWSGDGCLELLLAAGQNVRLRRSWPFLVGVGAALLCPFIVGHTCWTKRDTVAPRSPEHTQELRGGPSFKSPTMLFSVGTISRQKDTELASRERGQGCPEEGPGHHRRAAEGGGAAAEDADEAAEDAADAGHRGL